MVATNKYSYCVDFRRWHAAKWLKENFKGKIETEDPMEEENREQKYIFMLSKQATFGCLEVLVVQLIEKTLHCEVST